METEQLIHELEQIKKMIDNFTEKRKALIGKAIEEQKEKDSLYIYFKFYQQKLKSDEKVSRKEFKEILDFLCSVGYLNQVLDSPYCNFESNKKIYFLFPGTPYKIILQK